MTTPSPRSWRDFFFPILCGAVGLSWIVSGYQAQQTGRGFAQTTKHGPMTGAQAMIVGAVCCACAGIWTWYVIETVADVRSSRNTAAGRSSQP